MFVEDTQEGCLFHCFYMDELDVFPIDQWVELVPHGRFRVYGAPYPLQTNQLKERKNMFLQEAPTFSSPFLIPSRPPNTLSGLGCPARSFAKGLSSSDL